MKKVPINEASDAQLRTFANETLGLNLPGNTKPETVRAKVAAAWDKEDILVVDQVLPGPQTGDAPRPAVAGQKPPEKEMVRVLIQVAEEKGGDEPIPIGVNGKIMLVPRGKPVDIPLPYFKVLESCVTHRYESLEDGGINPVPRKVMLYPYQRVA